MPQTEFMCVCLCVHMYAAYSSGIFFDSKELESLHHTVTHLDWEGCN